MRIEVEIPEYVRGRGFPVVWETGFRIESATEYGTFIISANREGLTTLARQLLTLAQPEVPDWTHMHYDGYVPDDDLGALKRGSQSFIIQKKSFNDVLTSDDHVIQ